MTVFDVMSAFVGPEPTQSLVTPRQHAALPASLSFLIQSQASERCAGTRALCRKVFVRLCPIGAEALKFPLQGLHKCTAGG